MSRMFNDFLKPCTFRRYTLALAILLFGLINITTLYHGHNWGGDFSQYLLHARNLLEGQPYNSNIALELWVVSPPAFPFLLMPFIYFFGLNLKILKLINVFFWLLSALVLGKIAHKRLGPDMALGIVLVLLSSPYFFWFKQNILSDIPFLFFITAGLFSASKYFEEGHGSNVNKKWLYLSLCLMFWAQITRLAGSTIFMATIIYVLITQKDKKQIFLILGVWVFAAIMLLSFGVSPWEHVKEIHVGFIEWIKVAYLRCADLLKYMIAFYIPPGMTTSFSAPLFPILEKVCDIINPFFLFGAAFLLFRKIHRRSISLIGVFLIIYFVAWAGWPLSGGERYGLPIFGLGCIVILEYMSKAGHKFPAVTKRLLISCLAVLMAHNAFSIYKNYDFNDDYCLVDTTRSLAEWIKDQTPQDARFMFYKPRILSLLTNRPVATNWNFWQFPRENQEDWLMRLKRLKIDYVIKAKGLNDYWFLNPREVFTSSLMIPVWQNEEYIIFRILRENSRGDH